MPASTTYPSPQSVHVLHSIFKAKGETLPKPLPVKVAWSPTPSGAVPANAQMEAGCLALRAQDALADHFASLWAEDQNSES